MRRVVRSALVPYSAAEMYQLVSDVESYPAFLPWCGAAEVHSRDGEMVEATLEMHRRGLSKRFRTRNRLVANERIEIRLVDGPFRHLDGLWQFVQIQDAGSKISLDMSFEFAGRAIDSVFGRFFEDTCNALVAAFVDRAALVYARSGNGDA